MSDHNKCEDWCHCKTCGGFKLGGVPYGHSCFCPENQHLPQLNLGDPMLENYLEIPNFPAAFTIAELNKISLKEGDVLSVKLTGDNFSVDVVDDLRDTLGRVFKNNKVMVFAMPKDHDIKFEVVESEIDSCQQTCADCNCGKGQMKGPEDE